MNAEICLLRLSEPEGASGVVHSKVISIMIHTLSSCNLTATIGCAWGLEVKAGIY